MILITGATGFTGGLIAEQLVTLGADLRLAGRDEKKLDALRSRFGSGYEYGRLDLGDEAGLKALMEGARVVLNCAGPFSDLAEPIVKAALSCAVHYLDITGEQYFVKQVLERHGGAATLSGVVLAPACGFDYAIGDAAADLAAESIGACEELQIGYFLSGLWTSPGTRKSFVRVMAAPGFLRRNNLPEAAGAGSLSIPLDVPGAGLRHAFNFPGGEVFLVPLHVSVKDLTTAVVVPLPAPVVSFLGIALPLLLRCGGAGLLMSVAGSGRTAPTLEERRKTEFTVVCSAKNAGGKSRVVATGADPYGLTAVIAARLAKRVDEGGVDRLGPVSPSMIAGSQFVVDSTRAACVNWTY